MNQLFALALTLCLTGCATTMAADDHKQKSEQALSPEVREAIVAATKAQDFRLYAFAGRKVTLPGLDPEEAKQAEQRCGKKFLPNTSDVLRTEADRVKRRGQYDFASQYNRHMYQLCLNQS